MGVKRQSECEILAKPGRECHGVEWGRRVRSQDEPGQGCQAS